MALYKLKTQINKGRFKGKKVQELALTTEGKKYLLLLHNGKYNIKLSEEVLTLINTE